MILPIMQFPSVPCYLVRLRPKYLPQSPIHDVPLAHIIPSLWETKFHAHTKQKEKSVVMFILIFIFLDSKGKAKGPWVQPTLNFSVNAFVFISLDPQ